MITKSRGGGRKQARGQKASKSGFASKLEIGKAVSVLQVRNTKPRI